MKKLLSSPLFKLLKVINMELGIFVNHDKMQLLDKGHDSGSYIFGVISLLDLKFLSKLLIVGCCL
jgi:hypothetical protein